MNAHWIFKDTPMATPNLGKLSDDLGISEMLAKLLILRGLRTPQEMDLFLSPGLRHLAGPSAWPELERAAEVTAAALNSGAIPLVWGDYDVDGITATALVTSFLEKRGFRVLRHIPDRLDEGYGLNVRSLERLAGQGAGLLITVDCGISNRAEVARAKELGLTVVLTDHHLHKEGTELPAADVILDPKLCACPCPDLAGVGVAFLLCATLNGKLPGQRLDMRDFLDLVALGTLADVVNLTGQNRILVKNGMLMLAEARRPGIAALKHTAGIGVNEHMGASQITYTLAPRLNAAGRIGQPESALRLLLTQDRQEAGRLAADLDILNSERRAMEEKILNEACAQAEEYVRRGQDHPSGGRMGLVLYSPDWHQGVIGIVASRVVERYYRPALLLASGGEFLKGSGRGTRELDLYKALVECSDLFLTFGGHKLAAGFSIPPEHLDEMRDRFDAAVRAQLGDTPHLPSIHLDSTLGFESISMTFLNELEMLQPFGPGNPEPLFASPPVEVRGHKYFGRDHAALDLHDSASGVLLRGKAWRQAANLGPKVLGKRMRFAFTPKISTFGGLHSIELRIRDWQDAPRQI